jgi:hypothetical protein
MLLLAAESDTKIAPKMKLPNIFVIKAEYWNVTGEIA